MWLWSSASFCQRSANRGNCLHGRNVFGSMYDKKCRNYNIRSAPVTYKNFKISKKLWNISWMQIVYDKKQNKRELWANHFLLFCIYDSILIIRRNYHLTWRSLHQHQTQSDSIFYAHIFKHIFGILHPSKDLSILPVRRMATQMMMMNWFQ